jgi:hypothetical protein
MDPHTQTELSSSTKAIIHDMIDSGLTWVFVAMAALAALQVLVTLMMPPSRGKLAVKVDPLEAMQG